MKTCGYHTSQRTSKYFNDQGENTLQGDQDCCHIVFFLGLPCLNFNYVIIMKDFHNVFTYYGRSKPK